MGRHSKIDALPDDIRLELTERIRDSGFSCYVDHETWIRGLGYSVSRGALQRYGASLEFADESALRLKCLEIAASYSDNESIIKNATKFDHFRDATKMVANRVTRGFTGLDGAIDRVLEVFPAVVAKRLHEIAGKPEFNAFVRSTLAHGVKLICQ